MKLSTQVAIISWLIGMTTVHAYPCPARDAIHCAYIAVKTPAKWIRLEISPMGQVIQLCMQAHDTLYLERDDIEHDKIPPGTGLHWQFYQCATGACIDKKWLGEDKFILEREGSKYYTHPDTYQINIHAQYGENCQA